MGKYTAFVTDRLVTSSMGLFIVVQKERIIISKGTEKTRTQQKKLFGVFLRLEDFLIKGINEIEFHIHFYYVKTTHVFFVFRFNLINDNYYTFRSLYEDLLERKVYSCGTVKVMLRML